MDEPPQKPKRKTSAAQLRAIRKYRAKNKERCRELGRKHNQTYYSKEENRERQRKVMLDRYYMNKELVQHISQLP